jgi:hypothetical protein
MGYGTNRRHHYPLSCQVHSRTQCSSYSVYFVASHLWPIFGISHSTTKRTSSLCIYSHPNAIRVPRVYDLENRQVEAHSDIRNLQISRRTGARMAELHSVDIDVQIERRLKGRIEMSSAKEIRRLPSASDTGLIRVGRRVDLHGPQGKGED